MSRFPKSPAHHRGGLKAQPAGRYAGREDTRVNDDYGDERFGYSNWLDGGPEHASQPSAADLTEDYLPVDTDGSNTVDDWAACPICGESDHDNLVNRDGIVHCATCGHDYDLEPEREEASNA
jgi:hypothetical protein